MDRRARRGQAVVAAVVLVIGAWAFAKARGMPFAGPEGVKLLERVGPVGPFSPLAAVVSVVLALAALSGAVAGLRPLVLLAGVGFGAAAALVLAQAGMETKWLAGSGSTMAVFTAAAMGLILLALVPGEDDRAAEGSSGTPAHRTPR